MMPRKFTGNFARRQPPALPDGTLVERANLSQQTPGTVLKNWVGKKLTIVDSNLVNVAPDPAWTVKGCNVAQVIIPPPPTEKEVLLEEKAQAIEERVRLGVRIAEIDELIQKATD